VVSRAIKADYDPSAMVAHLDAVIEAGLSGPRQTSSQEAATRSAVPQP
jgi:hypothetical protein